MNVLIVEDELIVRDGIKMILEESGSVHVAGVAKHGAEALEILASDSSIDIVLTDTKMPIMNGRDLCKNIALQKIPVKVIMLSMLNAEQEVVDAFAAGAKGYMLKSVNPGELIYSLQHVQNGGTYLCSELAMKYFHRLYFGMHADSQVIELSTRETEVLSFLARGLTSTEISDKMFLSRRTVEGYRQELMDKTGSKNTAELIHYAARNKLIM